MSVELSQWCLGKLVQFKLVMCILVFDISMVSNHFKKISIYIFSFLTTAAANIDPKSIAYRIIVFEKYTIAHH